MTTELEKQFFDTFGIEPKYHCSYHDCNCPIEDVGKFNKKCPKQAVTKECDVRSHKAIYPQITNCILLELIRLGLNYDFVIHSKTVKELKEKLLALLMYNEAEFKQQVQALFKE